MKEIMKSFNVITSVKINDILYLKDNLYAIVLSKKNYLECEILRSVKNTTYLGFPITITNKDLSKEDWYKLNKSESKEIKISLL